MNPVARYHLEKALSEERNAAKRERERQRLREVVARLEPEPIRKRQRRAVGDSPRASYDRRWYRDNRERKIAAVKARQAMMRATP